MRKHQFTRGCARASVGLGFGLFGIGLIAGVAMLSGIVILGVGRQEFLLLVLCAPLGVALIVGGQLLLIFLDQRALLARIARHFPS